MSLDDWELWACAQQVIRRKVRRPGALMPVGKGGRPFPWCTAIRLLDSASLSTLHVAAIDFATEGATHACAEDGA